MDDGCVKKTIRDRVLESKYVAKKTNDCRTLSQAPSKNLGRKLTFKAINPSAMACDIPTPSLGDVPRPSSSTSTKDLGVARPMALQ